MKLKPYGNETNKYYRIEMCNAKEAAERGKEAVKTFTFPLRAFDLEKMQAYMEREGYDTVEIVLVTEEITRFVLEVDSNENKKN